MTQQVVSRTCPVAPSRTSESERRHHRRSRRSPIGIVITAAALACLAPGLAHAVDVAITADNAYAFAYGTGAGILGPDLSPAVENCSAGAIWNCGPGPETYTNVSNAAGGYLYIIAYSDDATTQGVLGQFANGAAKTYTGIGGWEVYATGIDVDPTPITCAGTTTPSLATINAQIGIANAGTGGPGSSVRWVTQAGGGVGVLASGELNTPGGTFPEVCPTVIDPAARWMWYNPDPTTISNPFSAPAPTGEFLIFRLPVSQVLSPTAYYVNKDIKNTSGVTANGIEMEVLGHSTYTDIYHATTPTFSVDATGANDKLRWTGGSIAVNSLVHVGFRTSASTIEILSVRMIDNSFNSLGCAVQLNTGIHTNGNLKWDNTVTNCASTSLFIGNVALEYYANEVPLSDLNGTTVRSPMQTVNLDMAPTMIAPGASCEAPMANTPSGARWVVIHQKVGTTAAVDQTEDWVQVPVPPGIPAMNTAGIVALGLLSLATGSWFLWRRL